MFILWSNRFYSIFQFSFDVLLFWAGSPLCSMFVVVVVLRCGLTTAKASSLSHVKIKERQSSTRPIGVDAGADVAVFPSAAAGADGAAGSWQPSLKR